MDMFLIVLLVVTSSATTGGLTYYNVCQTRQQLRSHRRSMTFAGKWELPPPGLNFDLYKKVKDLLDTLESEKKQAERERDEVLRKLTESEAEIDRLEKKLERVQDVAQGLIQSWTHSKMQIRFDRESEEKNRPRGVMIL